MAFTVTALYFSRITALVSIVFVQNYASAGPVVETTYGKVEGVTSQAHDGTPVNIFRGIPFASPPIDDQRWKVRTY